MLFKNVMNPINLWVLRPHGYNYNTGQHGYNTAQRGNKMAASILTPWNHEISNG